MELSAEVFKKESLIQLIHETATESLFVKDHEGRYIHANVTLANDLGRSCADELLHVTDKDFFNAESWETIKNIDEQIIQSRKPFRGERILTARNGRRFLYHLSKRPWIVRGECLGVVGWAIDVTAKAEVVQHLKLALEEQEFALDRVAHDMKTHFLPLEEYCSYLPALCVKEASGCLADLDAMAQDLKMAANQSSAERGKKKIAISVRECNIQTELDVLRAQQQLKTLEFKVRLDFPPIEVHVDAHSHHSFYTDPSHLRHAIGNIISNAIKFTHEDTEVTVRCKVELRESRRWLVCEVSDMGPGIDEATKDDICKKFVVQEKSKDAQDPIASRPRTGLGLGLYVAKTIVTALGGNLIPGNRTDGNCGATFFVEIPESPVEDRIASLLPATRFANLDEIRILLVDDQPRYVRQVAARLQNYSRRRYKVETAFRSDEAIAMWNKKKEAQFDPPYHVVVLDFELPDRDGPTTARLLRENYRSQKTLLVCMTASLSERRFLRARGAKMDVAFEKGSGFLDQLVSVIEGHPSRLAPIIGSVGKLAQVDSTFVQNRLAKFPHLPAILPDLVKKLSLMRDQYKEEQWPNLANTAHDLGNDLSDYDLNCYTKAIEKGVSPKETHPADPSLAYHALVNLENLTEILLKGIAK